MLLGAFIRFVGNLLQLYAWRIFQVIFFWQAFLVLPIVGECLELSRVFRPLRVQQVLLGVLIVVYLTGILLANFNAQLGTRINSIGLIFISLWSLRNDIAWRNLRHKLLLTRYIAWCFVLGFIWFSISGALSLGFGVQIAGPIYDALLHSIFIGFVISMIFGHAPIIFPAILNVPTYSWKVEPRCLDST